MCVLHPCCVFTDVFFVLYIFCFSTCLCVCNSKVHCGSALGPGASGLYYCTPLVCVPAVSGALAVWRQNTTQNTTRVRSSLNARGAEKEHTRQLKGGGRDPGVRRLGAGLGCLPVHSRCVTRSSSFWWWLRPHSTEIIQIYPWIYHINFMATCRVL